MARPWVIELRGGDFDGWTGACKSIEPVLIAWSCGGQCPGHATFDAAHPGIVLKTSQSYRLAESDRDEHTAVYEVGDLEPDDVTEGHELAGAGAGLGSGWPVSR